MSTTNCKVDHPWYTPFFLQLHKSSLDLHHHSKSKKRTIMKTLKTHDALTIKNIWLRRKETFKKRINEPKNLMR